MKKKALREAAETKTGHFHCQEREPPLPHHLRLSIHAQTRSKKLVNQLKELCLNVSYSRVDEIANDLATSICNRFKTTDVVCPLNMQLGLFTVGAIDNIDHNTSSTTSKGSFHGTGISLFQFPGETTYGSPQAPVSYSIVPTVSLAKSYACIRTGFAW